MKTQIIRIDDMDSIARLLPYSHGDNSERLNRLKKALPEAIKLLTQKQQYIIYQIYVLERPQREIAKELGINDSTICRTKQRALKRLKDYLRFLL